MRKVSIGGAVALVGAAVVAALVAPSGGPPLTTSCSQPAVRLLPSSVQAHDPVHWSATGPAGTRFVLKASGHRLGPPVQLSSGCTGSGVFGAQLRPGHYHVSMVRLGGGADAPLAQRTLTVTPRKAGFAGIGG
jgi:hypothetical protein